MNSNTELGGFLPVPSVQDIASKGFEEIPRRYIRQEADHGDVASGEERDSFQMPIIDMSKLVDENYQCVFGDGHDELARLHDACKDCGFFQVVNHGVSEEVIEKMTNSVEEFFKLSKEEKKAYSQLPNKVEGYGHVFVFTEDQLLDWQDMFFIITRPIDQRNHRFWPTNPTCFRESIQTYSSKLNEVGAALIKLMSQNLRINSEAFLECFEGGRQGVKMNFYPPCKEALKVLGITPHCDPTGLTLLLQANDVEGLQFKRNNLWVPVKPIPGALIVNIGDIIEIMSNGEYKSIEHRVIVDPEKHRLSIATFHNPKSETMIGPIPTSNVLNEVSDKAKYRTVGYEEFLRTVFSSKQDSKSVVDNLKVKE